MELLVVLVWKNKHKETATRCFELEFGVHHLTGLYDYLFCHNPPFDSI